RVEERLQWLSEEGDEPQQTCERWSKRSAFRERWCEFAVVVSRLNQLEAEAPTGNGEESTEEINELWRKRAELATEIVDAAVARHRQLERTPGRREAIFLRGGVRQWRPSWRSRAKPQRLARAT